MKIKHIIGAILLTFGLLVCLAAIGHLDFLSDSGVKYEMPVVVGAAMKSGVGVIIAAVGLFLCRDIEFDESEANFDEDTNRL